MHNFVGVLALELARHGITVNHIGPGWVQSALNDASPELQTPEGLAAQRAVVPLKRDGYITEMGQAAAYLARLDEVEAEAKSLAARIPPERRKIITSHDAFRYFEAAYGIDFVSPQGVSTEAEASAKDVGRIIQQIRREKIAAVFVENVSDARLMERIAKETGARIGERVYSDALSEPGGPAGTYIDMMRHNIRAFSAALSS